MEFVNYKIDDIIISIKTGKTPSTKERLYFDGDIPWITTSDLKGQKVLDYTEKTISKLALIENEAFTFEKNTVIVSTIGEIGKACIIKKPMACNQQLSGIVVNDNIIHPELFYYWLVKNQELLKFKANKAIISILNNKLLRSIPISFPKNLENQRKIIAQLDQIQNVIDLKIKTIEVYDKLSSFTTLLIGVDLILIQN
jgi:type I restriction enzyme S subunit